MFLRTKKGSGEAYARVDEAVHEVDDDVGEDDERRGDNCRIDYRFAR